MPRESRYLSRPPVIGAAITIILIFCLVSGDKSLFVAKAELIDLLIYMISSPFVSRVSLLRPADLLAPTIFCFFDRASTPLVDGVHDKSTERVADCYRLWRDGTYIYVLIADINSHPLE